MKGWQPHRTPLIITSIYIIALTFLCVYLRERVRELETVLTLCNSHGRCEMKRYILVPIKVGSEVVRDLLVEGQTYNGGTTARLTCDGIVEVQKGYRVERYLISHHVVRDLPEEEFIIPYAQPFEVVEKSSWRYKV